MKRCYILIIGIVLLSVIFTHCIRDKSINPDEIKPVENNLMIVYPNHSNKITLVDYNTLEIVKKITVAIPDSLQIHTMCLSTNHDYFVFSLISSYPSSLHYIMSYNISQDSIHTLIPTNLKNTNAPRLSAAFIPEQPGLVYYYSHGVGLYSIDIFNRQVQMISNEKRQNLGMQFYSSPDKKTIAILKRHSGSNGFTEIEFYDIHSDLNNFQFVLNENNQDSIRMDDLVFDGNERVFVSIRLTEKKWIENYFGSYDLKTKKLFKSSLVFPWSINPYFMEYSKKRQEVYLIGASNKLFVIDTKVRDYTIKAIIDLPKQISDTSRILLRPDENVVFVSCSMENFIIAIDLGKREVIKKIDIELAHLMLLL